MQRLKRSSSDKYGRGSAAANGVGFVDLAPGDTFDGLEAQLRARVAEVFVNSELGLSASIGSKRNANELAKHLAPGEDEEVHKFAAKNIGALFARGRLGIRHFDKKAIPGQRWIVRFIRVFALFIFNEARFLATVTLKDIGAIGNLYSVESLDITKDAWSERTPRGAIPEGLNAAPLLDLASFTQGRIAYYVGDCKRTLPEFVNRSEPFSITRVSELIMELCETPRLCDSALKSTPVSPVHTWLAEARNLGYVLTNLFPDERKIADWLRRDVVSSFGGSGGARVLAVREDGFNRLFYAAESLDAAAKMCQSYAEMHIGGGVLDVVGPQSVQREAAAKFSAAGFAVRKTLTRMQRRVRAESVDGVRGVLALPARPACELDADAIHAALHQYFDARAEQLPCREEVCGLCTNGASFVVENQGAVVAFLLGEVLGKKGTVRYWFTMPNGRGKGVGGSVMHAFLGHCASNGSTFQELWVLDDNENAIKRYQHYGFAFDRLKDTVWERLS